jgi:adenylate cyclase
MTLPVLFKFLPPLPAKALRLLITTAAILLTAWSQWPLGAAAPDLGNEWLRDAMLRARASVAPEQRLVVIDIDEASLAQAGPWPWPRERIASLIELLLGTYGARGVALDLVLPEAADGAGDARLAMLAQHGPLVLPHAFDYNGSLPLRVGQPGAGQPGARRGDAVAASGVIANHAGLAGARHIGNIGMIPDSDGMLRRLPMRTWYAGQTYPTLSLALMRCCGGFQSAAGGAGGGLTDGDGLRRIPYSRAWEAYTVVPAGDILAQRWPADLIADKLVLIGSSSLGLSDRVATPLSASTSGLLVHAAALTTLLDARDGLAPTPWPGRAIAVLFACAVALLAAYTFPRLSALANVALLGAASLAWLGLAFIMLPHDARFSVSGPLLSHLLLLAVGVPHAWQQAQRHSRRLLGTLRLYVADAVVDELLRSNLRDPLAPGRRDVTTLIADMEGYTGHVEALSVEQAALLTHDFLDCLTRPVLAQHGTLDKYTGDGLVAFWGAPLPVADHADQALDAALAIAAAVRQFNLARQARGEAPLRVRIGIESGVAMAGDFGSTSRSIYTAVGDSVNVASRLETLARDLPHDIIVGPGTAERARRHQLTRIGSTVLRGKEHSTMLYTPSGVAGAAT